MVPPDSDGISRVPPYSGHQYEELHLFAYGTFTLCGSTFQSDSAKVSFCNFAPTLDCRNMIAHNPDSATHPGLHTIGLGCSHFAHRYSGNRFCFLFLEVLRCFSSLRSLPKDYVFIQGMTVHYDGRVAPFGNLRINGYLHLTGAYRSLSRPS